eukprot:TRINITY_DN2865_c0_g3_i2.p1 TRINITY_DN2865_c0_g3~~TRINITY_DN2865_c0_g3_i2.p1  ORF type:complete len:484 (-),score=86.17 TRINITY_DN2865_c0_g3_i2:31-1482(-)
MAHSSSRWRAATGIILFSLYFLASTESSIPAEIDKEDKLTDLSQLQELSFMGNEAEIRKYFMMPEKFRDPINEKTPKGGQTALQLAVWRHNVEAVKILLQYGADPGSQDNNGLTAVHIAALHDDNIMYQTLKSSSLWKKELAAVKNYEGMTPLHFCAFTNAHNLAASLLYDGVEVDAKDDKNFTALMYSVLKLNIKVTKELLKHGANLKTQTPFGNSILSLLYLDIFKPLPLPTIESSQTLPPGPVSHIDLIKWNNTSIQKNNQSSVKNETEIFSKKNIQKVNAMAKLLLYEGADPNEVDQKSKSTVILQIIHDIRLFEGTISLIEYGAIVSEKVFEKYSLWDILEMKSEYDDVLETTPFRFLFLEFTEWIAKDLLYWTSIIEQEIYKEYKKNKNLLEEVKKIQKKMVSAKGSKLNGMGEKQLKAYFGLSDTVVSRIFLSQYRELTKNSRSKEAFSFYWTDIYPKSVRTEFAEYINALKEGDS